MRRQREKLSSKKECPHFFLRAKKFDFDAGPVRPVELTKARRAEETLGTVPGPHGRGPIRRAWRRCQIE
jgi:hypothetical protein